MVTKTDAHQCTQISSMAHTNYHVQTHDIAKAENGRNNLARIHLNSVLPPADWKPNLVQGRNTPVEVQLYTSFTAEMASLSGMRRSKRGNITGSRSGGHNVCLTIKAKRVTQLTRDAGHKMEPLVKR